MSQSNLTKQEGHTYIPLPRDIPTCYYCGSKDTYDVIVNDTGTYIKIYARGIGKGSYYYCKSCHKLFLWIDTKIGNLIRMLFTIKRRMR